MSTCDHEFEDEGNTGFLTCVKCGAWIEDKDHRAYKDGKRIKYLESQLEEARKIAEDAINEINTDPLVGRKFTVMELYKRLGKLKEKGE